MHRRRRPSRDKIQFSFDSFLDVVANVNGIIIRLIIVAWVGARTYSSTMHFHDEPIPDAPPVAKLSAPKIEDEPMSPLLAAARAELDKARKQLADKVIHADDSSKTVEAIHAELTSLTKKRADLDDMARQTAQVADRDKKDVRAAALSNEELQRRLGMFRQAIEKVEAMPAPTKVLRYRTPVSKTVTSEELFFECKGGKVTFVDLAGFLKEIEQVFPEFKDRLRTEFSVDETTSQIGAFRVRYTVERSRSAGEAYGGGTSRPIEKNYFGYRLGRFVAEPISPNRGETLEQALRPTSEFRQTVDALDAQTVVTFWVYPDSFAIFRTLREYLYQRGVEVAARPLGMDQPIAGSPSGTKSRGQ
jgi:hypothetical protein